VLSELVEHGTRRFVIELSERARKYMDDDKIEQLEAEMSKQLARATRFHCRQAMSRHVVRTHRLRAQTDRSSARNPKLRSKPPQRLAQIPVEHCELLTCRVSARQHPIAKYPPNIHLNTARRQVTKKSGKLAGRCIPLECVASSKANRKSI
jgi:hypothetical protein